MLRSPIIRVFLVLVGVSLLGWWNYSLTRAQSATLHSTLAERNTTLDIRSDRSSVLFPGDCVNIQWRVVGNRTVTIDDQPVAPAGKQQFCDVGFKHMPNVRATYPDGKRATLVLPLDVASMDPQNWILPFLALVSFLLAFQPFRWVAPEHRSAARLLALTCAVLALVTVFRQVDLLNTNYQYLSTTQLPRHTDVLNNTALGQWQYRVLTEYLVEVVIRLFSLFSINYQTAFIAFRIAQNFIFFLLLATYFRKLKLPPLVIYIGLSIVFWGMTHMLYDSDLQFNTYADATFYLIAALLIVERRYTWLVPLTALAALNRETSVLIPVMLIAAEINPRAPRSLSRHVIAIAVASGGAYLAVEVALRLIYGFKPGVGAFGIDPGIEMFVYNVGREFTWRSMFTTFSLMPFIAIFVLKRAPRKLQGFFWAIVPIWFVVHVFVALDEETRIFLVPFAVVFVPIVLCVAFTQIHQPVVKPVESVPGS